MKKLILSTGLLIVLVFLSYQVTAESDAQGGATTGEISPLAERHTKMTDARKARRLLERIAEDEATHKSDDVIRHAKVAAGANANARLSLDLIANGGSGNQRNDGVTSGTVSDRGTKIAIEVFATGVTTPLVGMQLRFDFDASLVTFVKAENSTFALNLLPQTPTGTDFAATSPVTLPSSNFLARAEFTTTTDVTGREFSIGIASVTLSESQASSDRLITRNRISFNVPTTSTSDFDGDGMVGFSDFLAFAGRYGTRQGDGRYQAKYDLNGDGTIDFSDFLSFAGSYGKPPPNGGGSSPNGEQRGGTPKMYWTDSDRYKIQRANLDGSNVEDLVTTGLRAPSSIALDVERGKMYWTDRYTAKIQRANLDGSNVEDLITTGLRVPNSIALDVGRGKMYWTDISTEKIQRANLDGSNVEDLVTIGVRRSLGIALDVGRGKMYWTDIDTEKIQRANLNGSQVEDLVTIGVRRSLGIALDVGRGKMYWTDGFTEKIQRADLDGSNVEDLITTGLDYPRYIALDVGRGKMYWTDTITEKIQRANLDGSQVEDLVTTGVLLPLGIALDTSGSSSSPDLIVESPSVSDSTLTPGQSFTLHATVRNRGTGQSASTTLRYYQSSRSTISTSYTEVGTASVSGLSASGTGSESISLTAPSRAGTYYYGACVASVSGESNTNNNCSDAVRVTVVELKPDLIVESPSVSDSTLTPGQSFTLHATVRNRGTGQSASTTLRYYQSSNATITTNDTEVGTASVSGLSASGTGSESISLTAPSSTGTYYYGACVDSVSSESNTDNNCSDAVRVTVVELKPDLIVESPSVSDSTLTPGQSFTLQATVRNRGTGQSVATTLRYYQSSNATITTNDTEVGTASVNGLSASGTGSESISLTAPSSTGMYYYGACVASVSGESNTDNNCSDAVRVTVSGGDGGGGGGGVGTPKMYWRDTGTAKIQRANLDGPQVEDLITTGLRAPVGIALDVGRGKMYWTDTGTAKIQCANLNGSEVEDLITTGLRAPVGIALDVGRGKMYWTDTGTSKIQRANLDGSNVEDLITTELKTPEGIALDVGREKMYWTDWGTSKIQRANLDGSNVEDLITTGLTTPLGIALDVGREKMYWTDTGTDEIQRANLDGSQVEDLITTGLSRPNGIALDVGRGKMYWTDIGTAKIQCANLDGSEVEDLITTGLRTPGGIALDTSGAGSISRPDLIVESPPVSDNTLTPGQSFILQATVRNRGTARSASTTLRYYQSSNAKITTYDTEVGTASVSGLSASGMGSESISLTAPSSTGTYYYGACVDSVSSESNTDNNCSDGVRVTVEVKDDHSNTRSDATSLPLDGSRSGQIEPGGDVDYFRVQVSGSGSLTVYTTGNTDTEGTLQNSSGSTLATDDDGGSVTNFSIEHSVSAGTYYIAVTGYRGATGSYTVHAVHAGVSSPPGTFHIDLVFPNDSDFTSSQKALFQQAATHWMSIITADLPDIDFSANPVTHYEVLFGLFIRVNDTVDDLRIYVHSVAIDGWSNTLGQAGPFYIRSGSRLPALGILLLDTADLKRMEEDGFLYSTILHEMGHALGIGSLWRAHGLLQNPSSTNPGADTHFTGARAIQAFNNAGGQNYRGAKVPVENERYKGQDGHWREQVLDHELMTGLTERGRPEALSAITIQSLADLGYQVDISRADAYSLPDPAPVSAKTAEGHGLSFENCIRSGPIYVVDEQGRVLRIIEDEEHPAKE